MAVVEREEFGNDGPIVSAGWLREHLHDPNVRVVDTRAADAYRAIHIPGAVNLDVYLPALRLRHSDLAERQRFDAALAAALGEIGVRPGDRLVFVEDYSGDRAGRGVWLAHYAGHASSAMLDGGLHAWQAAGGEFTRSTTSVEPTTFSLVPNLALLATADEIRDAVTDSSGGERMTVVDTRSDQEVAVAIIPTSIHLEWTHTLRPDGTLRPPEELRDLFAGAGITADPQRRVVTYCGGGFRAAHTYLVLRALGYPDVANYAPSWGEWGTHPDLPKTRG